MAEDEGALGETPDPQLRLRSEGIAARGFEEETIVLDMQRSLYLSMNPAGTVLWKQLEQGTTRAKLISSLLEQFEVDEERAAADVDAFVRDCRERGLLS